MPFVRKRTFSTTIAVLAMEGRTKQDFQRTANSQAHSHRTAQSLVPLVFPLRSQFKENSQGGGSCSDSDQ